MILVAGALTVAEIEPPEQATQQGPMERRRSAMWKRSRSLVAVAALVMGVACTDSKSGSGADSSVTTGPAQVTSTTVPGGEFWTDGTEREGWYWLCLLYTSPSPRD